MVVLNSTQSSAEAPASTSEASSSWSLPSSVPSPLDVRGFLPLLFACCLGRFPVPPVIGVVRAIYDLNWFNQLVKNLFLKKTCSASATATSTASASNGRCWGSTWRRRFFNLQSLCQTGVVVASPDLNVRLKQQSCRFLPEPLRVIGRVASVPGHCQDIVNISN